jgi:antitoxin component HigA of HigAB toxin-antitoxin module
MPRRGRLDEQQREQLRRAYIEVGESVPAEIPDSFEGRAAFERDHLSNQFVESVECFMRAHGISQQELAARLGVSEGRVSQILSGEQNLTLRTLAGLAAALRGHFHVKFTDELAVGGRSDRDALGRALPAARRRWVARANHGS